MKKIVTINIGEETKFETDNQCPIDDVIEYFTEVKSKGAMFIDWYAIKDYDGYIEAVTAHAYFERLETDEEYNKRLEEIKRVQEVHNKNTEMMERQKYLELKKKYEE